MVLINSNVSPRGVETQCIASLTHRHDAVNGIPAIDPGFGWQPGYYDHIIRGDGEYNRIELYIENNPAKWFSRHGFD
jgi:REP element-mobilizing transposase RayT